MSVSEEKFLSYYDRYADPIFRYCFYRLYHKRELAKEITQETFLRAWELSRKNDVDNMRALLYKIARNLIIDYSRKKKEESVEELEEAGHTMSHDPSEHLYNSIEFKQLVKDLDALETEYKEVLLMRYVDDLKPREIAEITGESVNVISVRITRAKQAIRTIRKIAGKG